MLARVFGRVRGERARESLKTENACGFLVASTCGLVATSVALDVWAFGYMDGRVCLRIAVLLCPSRHSPIAIPSGLAGGRRG